MLRGPVRAARAGGQQCIVGGRVERCNCGGHNAIHPCMGEAGLGLAPVRASALGAAGEHTAGCVLQVLRDLEAIQVRCVPHFDLLRSICCVRDSTSESSSLVCLHSVTWVSCCFVLRRLSALQGLLSYLQHFFHITTPSARLLYLLLSSCSRHELSLSTLPA